MIIESEFVKFVDICNEITMSKRIDQVGLFSIMKLLCPPIAWQWKKKHRKAVLEELQYFIEGEEGHTFLRSARSRALLDALRFHYSEDLTLAYIDVHISNPDVQHSVNTTRKESQSDLILHQKLPLLILFAGEGSFLSPYNIQLPNADFLQLLLCETVSHLNWVKIAHELNFKLQNILRSTLESDIKILQEFIEREITMALAAHGLHATLHASRSSIHSSPQLGIVIEDALQPLRDESLNHVYPGLKQRKRSSIRKGISALKKIIFCTPYASSETRMQATLGLCLFLFIAIDGLLTLYILTEVVNLKEVFILSLLIPPMAILGAPINGLLSVLHQSENQATAMRVHNVWNICSMLSVFVILLGKVAHTVSDKSSDSVWYHSSSKMFTILPFALMVEKFVQVFLVNTFSTNKQMTRIAADS